MGSTKPCAACGRTIEWRRKWAACWDEVRYCSDACRRHKPGRVDRELERTILELLDQRAATASICPSEAARRQFGEDQWRDRMETTRRAARRLVHQGRVDILQRGTVVDPSTAKGPIRIRRRPA